ncbi:MAG: DUF3883 domain-containing protein, partial [Anaerolineales bacterium]|nr:DUF3883 domain-containing protein [Anaerolineales bacterium]
GLMGGSVSTALIKDALRIGQVHELFNIKGGIIDIGEYSQNELMSYCSEDYPNYEAIRGILLKIIQDKKFYWLLSLNENIEEFKFFIPNSWVELLALGNLFDFGDINVIEWWRNVFAFIHQYDKSRLKKIGDVGEMLTFEYENIRLTNDGIKPLELYLQWVSKVTDIMGFDIQSIRSVLLKQKGAQRDRIQIEVKASVITNVRKFRFYVTRNEWETALKNIDTYFFYCWLGIDIKNKTAKNGPLIIPAKKLVELFPEEKTEIVTWTECKVIVDLIGYQI